jgi:hypothetical protein
MQSRVLIIAALILALTAAVAVPQANAEPLTIMAIVGVVTVLSAGSVDLVARSDEDNKDMRARQEETTRLDARAAADTQASAATAVKVATP